MSVLYFIPVKHTFYYLGRKECEKILVLYPLLNVPEPPVPYQFLFQVAIQLLR